jgi:hypothetical protein
MLFGRTTSNGNGANQQSAKVIYRGKCDGKRSSLPLDVISILHATSIAHVPAIEFFSRAKGLASAISSITMILHEPANTQEEE